MAVGFRCPLCRLALTAGADGFGCPNGHHFDRSREGYVNLLPGGRIKGRPAGDDEAMVRARRIVFDAGLYAPVIEALADAVATFTLGRPDPAILDCGCGEGSYLARAVERSGADGWGVDISKPAVRAAARRHRDEHLAVASSYALPFDDGCFDVAFSVFSPRPFAEMCRVVGDGGVAIVVGPGPDHLTELKALIYDEPSRHGGEPATDDEAWTTPVLDRRRITFDVDLTEPAMRTALVEMTPFWWSTRPEQRRAIEQRLTRVTADMQLTVFAVRR